MIGSDRQQSRLLPYLLVVLLGLVLYAAYTRLLRPAGGPVAVVATPAGESPSRMVTRVRGPEGVESRQPAPAASPAVAVPQMPSGRPNPFVALVTESRAKRAAVPPPPPPVPPPFFPGSPGRPGEIPASAGRPAGPQLVGLVAQDGIRNAVGVVELAQGTYIVREGDVVEGFRVQRIRGHSVVLRRGGERIEVTLPREQER